MFPPSKPPKLKVFMPVFITRHRSSRLVTRENVSAAAAAKCSRLIKRCTEHTVRSDLMNPRDLLESLEAAVSYAVVYTWTEPCAGFLR